MMHGQKNIKSVNTFVTTHCVTCGSFRLHLRSSCVCPYTYDRKTDKAASLPWLQWPISY